MGLVQTVFLDACTVIYWVEARDPWFSTLQSSLSALREQYGELRLAVSDISRLECLVKPLREQQTDLIGVYERFFQHPDLFIQDITPAVMQEALKIRVLHGVKTPDALQVASALTFDSDCIFLTADQRLARIDGLNMQCFSSG